MMAANKKKKKKESLDSDGEAVVEILVSPNAQRLPPPPPVTPATPPPQPPQSQPASAPASAPTPSAAPSDLDFSEASSSQYFVCSAPRVVVRTAPESSADEAGEVKKGDVLKAVARRGGWVKLDAATVGLSVSPTFGGGSVGGAGKPEEFWVLVRNRVKEMVVKIDDSEGDGAESWVKQQGLKRSQLPQPSAAEAKKAAARKQQQQQQAAAKQAQTAAAAKSETSSTTTTTAAAAAAPSFPCFYRTAVAKCTVRVGPGSSEDELAVLSSPGIAVKAVEGRPINRPPGKPLEWIRIVGVPEVAAAVAAGKIPAGEYLGKGTGGKHDAAGGMWLLLRNRHREMLVKVGEDEEAAAQCEWAERAGVSEDGADADADADAEEEGEAREGEAANNARRLSYLNHPDSLAWADEGTVSDVQQATVQQNVGRKNS